MIALSAVLSDNHLTETLINVDVHPNYKLLFVRVLR